MNQGSDSEGRKGRKNNGWTERENKRICKKKGKEKVSTIEV